jgi:hypothetical protein
MTWDHRMNQVLDEEVPMQIFNLALQAKQQQSLFERQYATDDSYSINITNPINNIHIYLAKCQIMGIDPFTMCLTKTIRTWF